MLPKHPHPETIKKAAETLTKTSPLCPQCGGFLEIRVFVDCWNTKTGEPTDLSKDFYCRRCDLRWSPESGPHDFKEEWKPELHRQKSASSKKYSSVVRRVESQ